jgi:SAM-dependent methyltransferase
MYTGNGKHYFAVGLSAVRSIEAALREAHLGEVRSVLDLLCGHGRVMRFLRQRFPATELTACDLDRSGVDFCRRHFGATPAYSRPNLDGLSLGGPFDLIWCGSLATHLDAAGTLAVLRCCSRHLVVRGLLVFTMHGSLVLERLRRGRPTYGLTPAGIASLAVQRCG